MTSFIYLQKTCHFLPEIYVVESSCRSISDGPKNSFLIKLIYVKIRVLEVLIRKYVDTERLCSLDYTAHTNKHYNEFSSLHSAVGHLSTSFARTVGGAVLGSRE